ncbi:hypothetical protein [Sinorhizobium fredii]|uniref:hypothetical protein n=1 Tax=Rhizobium fredii TaxID=380 RepID=UPI000CF1D230|nr:hypothetical protein [Sinorhizobium fredii]
MVVLRMRYTIWGYVGVLAFLAAPVIGQSLLKSDWEKAVKQTILGRMHEFDTVPYTLLGLAWMLGLCMMLVGRETFKTTIENDAWPDAAPDK